MNISENVTTFNENINLVGLSSFITPDGNDDIREIERSLVKQEEERIVPESNSDIAAEFQKRIQAMESAVGVSLTSDTSAPLMRSNANSDNDDNSDDDNDDNSGGMGMNNMSAFMSTGHNGSQYNNIHHNDPKLVNMSEEQQKQRVLQNALNSINTTPMVGSEKVNLDMEKTIDNKHMILEQINMLRTNLEDDDIKIGDIQMVTFDNTYEEIESAYKQLRYRNDHARYCGFANETAQMGASFLEWAFDGEKNYFGLRPDLTGWGATLNVKMRRLSYETSSLVSDGMRAYNLGNFSRICFELFPSMVLHSKTQKSKRGKTRDRPSDAQVSMAMNKLRDIDN